MATRLFKLSCGVVSIAALCVLAIEILPAVKKPPPLVTEEVTADKTIPAILEQETPETNLVAVEEVTIKMLAPYLDATQKMIPGLELKNCSDDTSFDKLPDRGVSRNRMLETLALEVAFRFRINKTGDRLSKHIPIVELDDHLRQFQVGDSPWGLFEDPRLQNGIEPYLKAAQQDALTSTSQEIAATIPAPPPS